MAKVYMLHFDPPYRHAKHYVGFTPNGVKARLKQHQNGNGAKLTAAVAEAGHDMVVARTWDFGKDWLAAREYERTLKRQGGHSSICPVCNPVLKIEPNVKVRRQKIKRLHAQGEAHREVNSENIHHRLGDGDTPSSERRRCVS